MGPRKTGRTSSVTKPWPNAAEAVRVSTSTTHPAMAELFTNLFSPYGHVSKHPRYKKDTQSYEWNLNAVLDGSFKFLDEEREAAWKWIAEDQRTSLAYIAGVFDAEGHVALWEDKGRTTIGVGFSNTNTELLTFIGFQLRELGYVPGNICINKREGTSTSKYQIQHRKDYWQLLLQRFADCQSLLRVMPIRHREKVQKAEFATSLVYKQAWSEVQPKYAAIRDGIHSERNSFVAEAERIYKTNHDDPNY